MYPFARGGGEYFAQRDRRAAAARCARAPLFLPHAARALIFPASHIFHSSFARCAILTFASLTSPHPTEKKNRREHSSAFLYVCVWVALDVSHMFVFTPLCAYNMADIIVENFSPQRAWRFQVAPLPEHLSVYLLPALLICSRFRLHHCRTWWRTLYISCDTTLYHTRNNYDRYFYSYIVVDMCSVAFLATFSRSAHLHNHACLFSLAGTYGGREHCAMTP